MQVTTKQVQDGVPVWDIIINGAFHGCITIFPNEGPMATVKVDGSERTLSAPSFDELVNEINDFVDYIEDRKNDCDEDDTAAYLDALYWRAVALGCDSSDPNNFWR
jgi:hypothetical protein